MTPENKGKLDHDLSRRKFMGVAGGAALGSAAGLALAGCPGDSQPSVVEKVVTVTKEVEKIVTREVPVESVVIKEVIKEVPVDRVVTKEVPVETDVAAPKEPTVVAEAPVTEGPVTEEAKTPVASAEVDPLACYDGELILNHNVPVGEELPRTPVGEAERADIMEVSWWGDGFGGYDRAIVVIPRLGPVWQVNVKDGAATIATRGFCGTPEEVETWAVKSHLPSFQQASRDPRGDQPEDREVAVYRLDFEKRTMSVVSKATHRTAPTPEWVLSQLDVSFREGDRSSAVEMHVAK